MRGRRLVAIAAILGVVVGASVIALAGDGGTQQAASPNAPALSLVRHAKAVSAVAVATSDFNDTSTSTTTPTQLPGMKETIAVPANSRALLLIRFSAESACYGGGTNPNWCIATIRVDGIEAAPATGRDFALDSTDNGTESGASWESHAMDRSIVVGPGLHTVVVMGSVTDFGATGTQTFWTGERSLTVERALI